MKASWWVIFMQQKRNILSNHLLFLRIFVLLDLFLLFISLAMSSHSSSFSLDSCCSIFSFLCSACSTIILPFYPFFFWSLYFGHVLWFMDSGLLLWYLQTIHGLFILIVIYLHSSLLYIFCLRYLSICFLVFFWGGGGVVFCFCLLFV